MVALHTALAHFHSLAHGPASAAAVRHHRHQHTQCGDTASLQHRRFFAITIEEAERFNATLANCALSAWAMAVYERLLSHPLRTQSAADASVVFAPPHGAWDFHWARGGPATAPAKRL